MATTPVFLGFLGGSAGKESACNAEDPSLIPGLGRSPGEGKRYPLQYSGLENSMECTVRGVAESNTTEQLHFHFLLLSRRTMFNNLLPCLYDEDDTLIAQLVKNLPAMQETLV